MQVKIEKLNEKAKIPTQAKEKDFCYDVYATSCKRVGWRTWEYGIGLAFEVVRPDWIKKTMHLTNLEDLILDEFKIALDFRPRSSVWKTGMILSNCVGTLDELYRGEVKAYFYRINPFKKKYKVGDRIGQICLNLSIPIEFEESEVNKNTDRGTGGFGSTGR